MEYTSLEYSLLSIQCALLEVISPEIRAVAIDLDANERIFYIYYYYEGEVTEEIKQIGENTINEVSKVLGDFEHPLDGKIERIDFPKTMPFRGRYAYHHKE